MNNANEIELYLNALAVLKGIRSDGLNVNNLNLHNSLHIYLCDNINLLLTKEVLVEALEQDLIYLQCYKLYDKTERLTLSCFKEDIFIVDVLLNYAGNLPINIYCGAGAGMSTKLGCINLKQLKSFMYMYNELL